MSDAASGSPDASLPQREPASLPAIEQDSAIAIPDDIRGGIASEVPGDGPGDLRDERPSPDDPAGIGGAAAPTGLDTSGRPWPPFAHGSEAEMARILDFYEVRWEYEPRTFPILLNLDGDVVESFSPDFYLPDLDLFLEMTTLRQRLVRKKNRKLRRLRELYPDIRIKLFYARDFRAMLLKYGRLALADSLSGTLGQVMPDRGRGLAEDVEVHAPHLLTEVDVLVPVDLPSPVEPSPRGAALPPATPHADAANAEPSVIVGVPQPGLRRNASRSRRRRAAAAARAAARAMDPTTGPGQALSDEGASADHMAR